MTAAVSSNSNSITVPEAPTPNNFTYLYPLQLHYLAGRTFKESTARAGREAVTDSFIKLHFVVWDWVTKLKSDCSCSENINVISSETKAITERICWFFRSNRPIGVEEYDYFTILNSCSNYSNRIVYILLWETLPVNSMTIFAKK